MSDHLQEGRRLAMHLPRDSVEAPRMIADALAAAETAERERIRKLALEPSEKMVRALMRSLCVDERRRIEDWKPHARAILRAFAEEIGR